MSFRMDGKIPESIERVNRRLRGSDKTLRSLYKNTTQTYRLDIEEHKLRGKHHHSKMGLVREIKVFDRTIMLCAH